MFTARSLPRYISIALYALLFLGGASAAQAGRIYEKTYRSIVESIYSAQGQAYIDITEGRWQTDRRGTTLTWLIERPTTLKTKFNYASGNLLSASAEFDQPIVIEMRSGKYCLRYKIKRIFYGEAGRLISPETRGPNPDWAVDANCRDVSRLTRQIDQHLEFSSDVQSLFYGRPFASSSSSRLEGRNTLVPMVTRVQLFPSVDNNGQPLPALKVKLRNYYSMALGADSYLVISEKSGFQFSRFDYYIPTQEAYGNLDDFSLEVYSGRLSAGPTKFVISTLNGSPVNLHFRNVAFEKDHQIAFAKGSLQTSLGEGSEILLSADQANLSSLKLIPPSNLAAQDLSLSVQDGTPDRLFVGHATCTATVVDGRLALGPTDHLRISSAHVSLELNDSFWQSPGRPLVLGRIYDLDVNVAGGELRINQESKLSLAQGRVAATSLNIDSRLNVPITGAFKQLRIDVSPESQLTYAPIFSLITIDGNQGDRRIVAQLIADDSANPLTIQANVPYLSGKFALQVPFRKGDFKLGKTGKIVNASGYFEGGINIANKDQVTGSFNFDVSSPSGEIAVNGATTLLISGIKAKGSNFQFVNTAFSSGTLIEAKMNIDSGAEFSLPGGFRILTDGGGYLAAQRLSVGSNAFLVGDYQLSMPFIKFSNGNDNSFSLTRGQALLNLSNRPDGSITGGGL